MNTALGHKIRDRRKDLGETQEAVATKLGVTQQTVAAWESGKRPAPVHFDRIAGFINLPREEVIGLVYPASSEQSFEAQLEALRDGLTEQLNQGLQELRSHMDDMLPRLRALLVELAEVGPPPAPARRPFRTKAAPKKKVVAPKTPVKAAPRRRATVR